MLRYLVLAVLLTYVAASMPPTNVTTYKIDLDIDPEDRWTDMVLENKDKILAATSLIHKYIPRWVVGLAELLFEHMAKRMGDFGKEMKGIAKVLGRKPGEIALLNLAGEFVSCTSIVSEMEDGSILHGRNLDWGEKGTTPLFQNLTVEIEFMQGGKLAYRATTFAGYVGVLTGMRKGHMSVSSDWRAGSSWKDIAGALFHGGAPRGFVQRDALQQSMDWPQAREYLSTVHIIGPVYYILGGHSSGQGVVIARTSTKAVKEKVLDTPKTWFVAQTNSDWWKPGPEPRHTAAEKHLIELGREHLSLETFYTNVMSGYPNLRKSTVYTVMMSASSGDYYCYDWLGTHHQPFHPPKSA